ncbi:MAG TPA: hypothetical protein VF755_04065 [Catenuloplanes sp.]|jgi:hypothetical protein
MDTIEPVGPVDGQPAKNVDMPVFQGAAKLVTLVHDLCDRPRRGELPSRRMADLPRGRHGLPLVCVVRPAVLPVLPALATYLATARPTRIPHALISCEPAGATAGASGGVAAGGVAAGGVDAVEQVADLLRRLAQRINRSVNAGYGRLRFPLFGLMYWLLHQDVRGQEPDRLLLQRLRERALASRRLTDITEPLSAEATAGPILPGWVTAALRVIPPLWFRIRVSGRVPLISRGYRWFLRQPHLAPRDPGTFVGFAERLTLGMRAEESAEEVCKLLVNAFLEDLRQAYRRRPWRPGAARRTTYLVAMLDGITRDNGGYELLRLINDVRNETGAFDPLLVISGSQKVPPGAAEPSGPERPVQLWAADRAGDGYRFWCQQFARDSRARKATAWFLPIVVPDRPLRAPHGPPTDADRRYVNEQQSLLLTGRFTAARPPWWSRRRVLALAPVVLAASLVPIVVPLRPAAPAGRECPGGAATGRHTYLEAVRGDPAVGCIGYVDGEATGTAGSAGGPFRNSPADVVDVARAIFAQNQQVDRLVADHQRVAFTLVYLGQLTGIPANRAYGYASDIEELTGLRLAQSRGIEDARTDPAPLFRIVIANAGYQMRYAQRAAELIVHLKRRDPTVLAVVGLVESRTSTSQALSVFQNHGLMSIAPTLSADRIPEQSHFYLQIAPPNRTQAHLITAYLRREMADRAARQQPITAVRVLYTTGGTSLAEDSYVETLSADLVEDLDTLPGQVFDGKRHDWAQQPAALPCQPGSVAVFAGRYSEFASFLNAVSRCPVPPDVIADDSTSRFMASPDFRQAAPNLPVLFVSKGQLASCAALATNSSAARGQFLRLARTRLGACQAGGRQLGERVGLAYDAATLVTDTVDTLLRAMADQHGRPGRELGAITSLAVHGDILHRYASGVSSYAGITGALSFTATGVPVDKAIALVAVDQVNDPSQVPVARYGCGRGAEQSPGCPPSTG